MCPAAPECIFCLDTGAIKSRVSWGFPLHHLLWIRWRGVEVCVALLIPYCILSFRFVSWHDREGQWVLDRILGFSL